MVRRLSSLLMLLVACLICWQAWAIHVQRDPDEVDAATAADREIRLMVMTQDLGYLRRQALDSHKAYWSLRKEQDARQRVQIWALGACGLVLLGLWGLQTFRPPR
jgi:hypothetical protein